MPNNSPTHLFWRYNPQWARASSFTRFLDHTKRRTTQASFGRVISPSLTYTITLFIFEYGSDTLRTYQLKYSTSERFKRKYRFPYQNELY